MRNKYLFILNKKAYSELLYFWHISIIILASLMFGCNRSTNTDHIINLPLEYLQQSAKMHLLNNNPDSALVYYSLIINACEDKKDSRFRKAYATACNNAGYVYFFHYGDYSEAYSYFQKAKETAESIDAASTLCRAYLNIGNIYSHYDLPEKTLEMYRQAMDIALKNQIYDIAVTTFINIVGGKTGLDNYSEISEEINRFSELTLPDTVKMGAYSKKLVEACRAFDTEDYPKAIKALNESANLIDTPFNKDRYGILAKIMTVDIYCRQKQYDLATLLLEEVIGEAENAGNVDVMKECYQKYHDILLLKGDTVDADHYRLLSLEMADSLFNARKLVAISEIEKVSGQKKLNEHIQILKADKRFHTYLTAVISVALGIILILLFFLVRKHRALNRSNTELYRQYCQTIEAREKDKSDLLSMRQRLQAFEEADTNDTETQTKVTQQLLSDTQVDDLYLRLISIMESDAIVDPTFSADTLATLAHTKTRYISYVLNLRGNRNFSTLLAEARVKRACIKLSDSSADILTLESIGESVGFKSRITFSNTFKKITGLSPKDYRKISRTHKSDDYQ